MIWQGQHDPADADDGDIRPGGTRAAFTTASTLVRIAHSNTELPPMQVTVYFHKRTLSHHGVVD